MKIDGARPVAGGEVRRTARGGKSGGGGFSVGLPDDEPVSVGSLNATGQIAKIDSLLALQEVADPLSGRRRTIKRGSKLLDHLDDIRHGLLLGEIPMAKLKSLAETLRQERGLVTDPGLIEVIDEIELRAQVALAKLQMAQ
jgi:hypothetical protein